MNCLSYSCTLITAEDVNYFCKWYGPLRQNDKYGYIISMLWYCTVREDISIYRYYLPVPKCDISMWYRTLASPPRTILLHERYDFCKLLNYLKILIALIVKADILCPLLSGYIASFKRNFVYCLLGDIAL